MSIEAILESIEKLTLLEAAELVKAMEEKFGVSAAAPVAVAAAPAAAAAPAEDADAAVNVILASVPADKKIAQLCQEIVVSDAADQLLCLLKRLRQICFRPFFSCLLPLLNFFPFSQHLA